MTPMTIQRPLSVFVFLTAVLLASGAASAGVPAGVIQQIQFSPQNPSPFEPIVVTLAGSAGCFLDADFHFDPPVVSGSTVTLSTPLPPPGICEPPSPWFVQVPLGPLPAGAYTLRVLFDGVLAGEAPLQVTDAADQLSLQSGRFAVSIRFTDPGDGGQKLAPAVRLSDQSGYFWFFYSANVEVTAKILDGRALNNHFWLFVASMTTVPFTVIVIDQSFVCLTAPCPNERTYQSAAGQNRNFIDLTL